MIAKCGILYFAGFNAKRLKLLRLDYNYKFIDDQEIGIGVLIFALISS